MRNRKVGKGDVLEMAIGVIMDLLPILCAVMIVIMAGRAYAEGYRLFVQEGKDSPGEAHSEMVTITVEDAGSSLAVGGLLEKQDLIGSKYFFALKTKLSGYEGMILPGTYILSSDMSAEDILGRICTDPNAETAGQEDGDAAETGTGENSENVKENRDVWGQ
ncbi:MAG: hypothetical protein Q4F43_02725 [Eubacteriales bacterium]|nr:hypothetical protein [Eubacteriales bacterium]